MQVEVVVASAYPALHMEASHLPGPPELHCLQFGSQAIKDKVKQIT